MKKILKTFKLKFLEKSPYNESVLHHSNSSIKKIPGHYVGISNEIKVVNSEGLSKGNEIVVISNIKNESLSNELHSKDILPNAKQNCTSGISEPKLFEPNNCSSKLVLKNKLTTFLNKDSFREHYENTKKWSLYDIKTGRYCNETSTSHLFEDLPVNEPVDEIWIFDSL